MTDLQDAPTATGDPQAIVRRFFEDGWNAHDAEGVADLIADGYDANDGGFFVMDSDVVSGLRRLHGAEALAKHLSRYEERFSDLRFTIDKLIVDGSKVVALWSPSGFVKGRTFTTRGGQTAHVQLGGQGVSIVEIVDGRIVRNDMYWPIGTNSD